MRVTDSVYGTPTHVENRKSIYTIDYNTAVTDVACEGRDSRNGFAKHVHFRDFFRFSKRGRHSVFTSRVAACAEQGEM